MAKALDRKDWICTQPFEFAEIFDHTMYMCCPQWLPDNLGNPNHIQKNWTSDKANKIRESIVDGSYSYCNENRCPKLNGLKEGKSHGFISRQEFKNNLDKYVDSPIRSVKFNFDQSCNLQCPSCRTEKINYEGVQRTRTEELIHNIEEQMGEGLERIETSGSGDPFFSRTFRKWLMEFDLSMYPNLKHIHLHTNGTLWNKSNWERMKKVHPFVKSCEISVDAAYKDTYENKTRIGGKWQDIIDNLKYISTLPLLNDVVLSFVVQHDNYNEMYDFYELGKSIFEGTNKNWRIFYNRVVNWGTFTAEQFKEVDICDNNHPNHSKLLKEYNKLTNLDRISHNIPVNGI
jgi:organic radical activating enzyme|tara:strand:- start:1725 stop:2759 length:1035 start_codon:yes stop_codon:yes gene_type:complete